MTTTLSAQMLRVGGLIAYNSADYSFENYTTAGYFPLGARIALVWPGFELGAEGFQNVLSKPTFIFSDEITEAEKFRQIFDERYLGGYLRIRVFKEFFKDAPGYLNVGGGKYFDMYTEIIPVNGNPPEKRKFKEAYSVMGGFGVHFPLSRLSLGLEFQANYSERESLNPENEPIEDINYKAWIFSLQAVVYLDLFNL